MIFLSVGQGDCTALIQGDEAILIDSGPTPATAERTIARRLRERGVARLRAVLLTHDDDDHTGGAATLSKLYPEARIWTGPYSRIAVKGPVVKLGPHQRIRFGDFELDVAYPKPRHRNVEDNELSSLIGLRVDGSTIALTGDSPSGIEEGVEALLPEGANILKAGHHGSARSTSAALLQALHPQFVIVSCGVKNRYGHPHPAVLARILKAGAKVYRTDRDGDITASPIRGGTGSGAWRITTEPAMSR